MPYSVMINGASVTILASTLSISNTIGKRSQASFYLRTDLTTHFQQYQQVQIYDSNNNLAFSGYIQNPQEQKIGFQESIIHIISCVDQHFLADKRIMYKVYGPKTVGSVVQDILNTILSQEGVTLGAIYDGLPPSMTLYPSITLYPSGVIGLLPSAEFVYCTVTQALDELVKAASESGVPFYWMIDMNKQLWFVPYTYITNSTLIDGTQISQTAAPMTVQRQNPTYRNSQYIIGGLAQTSTQVEIYSGNGSARNWTLGYPLASVPMIKINGSISSVGIKGNSSGTQFYWAAGDATITQDTSMGTLSNSDTIAFTYIGQYPAIALAQDSGQITYQASIDGTSGIIDEVETDASITSEQAGFTNASNLLTRYAVQGVQLTFITLQSGFAPGQLVSVDLPMHNINNEQMLIETVASSDQIDGINIWYTITAVEGPYDTTWVDFFSSLLRKSPIVNAINVGINQSISILESFSGSVSTSATMTVTRYACPLPSTTLHPSTTLFPC